MTGTRNIFAELDEKVTRLVRFGDGSKVWISGKCSIFVECIKDE